MQPEINSSQGLLLDTIPRGVRRLAEALSRLHGPAVIRNETNGYHIYLPSPECIKTDGRKELQSKHLTVNASKYLELPEWKLTHPKKHDKDFSAMCHKTNTRYRVTDLLNELMFPPLAKRGLANVPSHVLEAAVLKSECLVVDDKGNMVPPNPGKTTPIHELPLDHPAIQYLLARKYDPLLLYRQLRCAYCYEEYPENPDKGIFYKRLPMRFRDTAQGRIVFYADIDEVQVGWQARIIEAVTQTTDSPPQAIKLYWHPYESTWVPIEVKNTLTNKFEPIEGVEIDTESYTLLWKPSKYKTAFGMSRNEVLLGIDAAVAWNKMVGLKKPTVVLVEGPLDAARFGPPGVAMLGKYLSDRQADLLIRKFKKIIVVADNDKAGLEAKLRIQEVLANKFIDLVFVNVPSSFKDVGEMETLDALKLIQPHLI